MPEPEMYAALFSTKCYAICSAFSVGCVSNANIRIPSDIDLQREA